MTNAQSKLLKLPQSLTIATRNIRSLPLHAIEVGQQHAHVTLLQETETQQYHTHQVREHLKTYDKQIVHGHITNITKDGSKRGHRIATVVDYPVTLISLADDQDEHYQKLALTGRWQEHYIPTQHNSSNGFIVANMYGYAGASSDQSQYRANETLLADAIIRAGDFPDIPYFIIGDLNINPTHSNTLRIAMAKKILYDVTEQHANYLGQDPPPTFCREGVTPDMEGPGVTRIDAVLANAPGAAAVKSIWYDYDSAAGFDHVAIKVELNYDVYDYHIHVPQPPRPINIHDIRAHKWTQTQKHKLYQTIWQKHEDIYNKQISDKLVQQAHITWCSAMEEYLFELQSSHARRTNPRANYAPRGQTAPLITMETARLCSQFSTQLKNRFAQPLRIIALCKVLTKLNRTDPQHGKQYTCQLTTELTNLLSQEDQREWYDDAHLDHVRLKTEQHTKQCTKQDTKARREQLRAKLTDKQNGITNTSKYIKNDAHQTPTIIIDPHTHHPTSDPQQIHRIFLNHYEPYYHTHKQTPPLWQHFHDKYGEHVTHHDGAPRHPPSTDQLLDQAKRGKPEGASGLDGIKPAELALLPRQAWETRRALLQLCYETNEVPHTYHDLASPVIQKKNGQTHIREHRKPDEHIRPTTPDNYRLLGVFSALYRVESGATFRQHLPWLKTWLHPQLHGCIPERDLTDVAWDTQADIEAALAHEEELVIYLLDYVNFFDMFDHSWVRSFFVHLGINPQLANLIHNVYTNLTRRIKIGRHYGPQFRPTNGMAAGDSFALLAALCLVSCQFTYIHTIYPSLNLGACVDDRNIRGTYEQVTSAYEHVRTFDDLAGHFNNHKKLVAIATRTPDRRKLKTINYGTLEQPIHPKVLNTTTLVGETLNATKNFTHKPKLARISRAFNAASRAAFANTTAYNKAMAIATVAIPRILVGNLCAVPTTRSFNRLRTAILASVWSNTRAMRCAEVVVAVLHDPTRVDPWGAVMHHILASTRRAILRDGTRLAHYHRVYQTVGTDPTHIKYQGPAHALAVVSQLLNITLLYQGYTITLKDDCGVKLDLVNDDKTYFNKVVRHWVRRAFICGLANRALARLPACEVAQYLHDNPNHQGYRKDMQAITELVDIHATTHNIYKHKDDQHGQHIIRSFIAGSIRAGDRLHAAMPTIFTSDRCDHPECAKQNARHTTEHLIWECQHHCHTRKHHTQQIDKVLKTAAKNHGVFARNHLEAILANSTFRQTSICPDDPCAYKHMRTQDVEIVAELTPDPSRIITSRTDGLRYDHYDGVAYARIFTDGSALYPQSLAHATAGWAVFYAPNHPYNHRAPLKSKHQSSFRAEARAALHAIIHAAMPTVLYIDCKGIVRWLNNLMNNIPLPKDHPDKDIWRQITNIIRIQPDHFYKFKWIPSHLDDPTKHKKKAKYLRQGGTEQDIADNVEADKLANTAAKLCAPHPTRSALADYRAQITACTQNLMVDIWKVERQRHANQTASPQTSIGAVMDNDLDEQVRALQELQQADKGYDENPFENEEYPSDNEFHDFEPIDMDGNPLRSHATGTTNAAPSAEVPGIHQAETPSASCDNADDVHMPLYRTNQCDFKANALRNLREVQQMYPKYPYDHTIVVKDALLIVQTTKPLHRLPNHVPNAKNMLRIATEWWQPLHWFFSQLQWSVDFEQAPKPIQPQQYQTTFMELAIACDILTGDAVASGCDLDTKTRVMRAAFTHYYRTAVLTADGQHYKYKHYFQPVNHAGSTTLLGALRAHGIRRRMIVLDQPQLNFQIAAIIVTANQRATDPRNIGVDIRLPRLQQGIWRPEPLEQVALMCEDYAKRKNDTSKDKPTLRPTPLALPTQPPTSRKRPKQGPCYYGHPSTSLIDRTGTPRWNSAPTRPPLWPLVPPGATLCQKCYEHFRSASIKGTAPTIPAAPSCRAIAFSQPGGGVKVAATHATHVRANSDTPRQLPRSTGDLKHNYSGRPCSMPPPNPDPKHRRNDKRQTHHSALPPQLQPALPIHHIHTRPPDYTPRDLSPTTKTHPNGNLIATNTSLGTTSAATRADLHGTTTFTDTSTITTTTGY